MRLNGAAQLISVIAVAAALATTLLVAHPVFTGDDGARFSGPTHPIEPGGKDRKGGHTPIVVKA